MKKITNYKPIPRNLPDSCRSCCDRIWDLRQSRGRGFKYVVNLFFCPEVWRNEFVLLSLQQNMNYDISESVSKSQNL